MTEKLKPCPFCGEEDVEYNEDKEWIYCPCCEAEWHNHFKFKDHTIRSWNMRNDFSTKVVDEMYELLEKCAEEGNIEAYELVCKIKGEDIKQLKPCPFCGGKAEPYKNHDGWVHIRCSKCWAETDGVYDFHTAIEYWNQRHSEQREQPEDKWLQHDKDTNTWECSHCHNYWKLKNGNPLENGMDYCPICNTKMRAVETVNDSYNGNDRKGNNNV